MLKALSLIGATRVVSTAAQAGTLVVLARLLGPVEFGTFAAVLGVLAALSLLADGGATAAIGRHHATPGTIVQILRASRLLSLATLVISVPLLSVAFLVSGSAVIGMCVLLCAWVPLERQAEVAGAYLLARGREGVVGAVYVLRRVPTLTAIVLAPVTVPPVAVYSATMVTTAAVAVVVLGRRVNEAAGNTDVPRGVRERLVPDRAVWGLLRPYSMVVAALGVRQLDIAVLSMAAGPGAAGAFAPASRIMPALLLVPGTYTQLLLGRLSGSGQRLTASPIVGVAVVSAAAFVPLAVLADVWVPLVLGEAYAASIDVIRIVVVSLVLAAVSSVFASGLHASDRSAQVAAAVWSGVATTIALIAVLGAVWGALGAAAAVAVGYLVQCVLMAVPDRSDPRLPVPLAPPGGTKT